MLGHKPTVGGLFSGVGGIELAFKQAGYDIVWANEKDKYAQHTYRENFKECCLYDKDIKIYRYKVADILNNRQATNLRFFISNHITNLEINGTAVDKFIRKKTKRIIVNCSGSMKKYIVGPISQDIIYNSFTNT